MILYAKTNPKETIREHTNELLNRYDILKQNYQKQIEQCLEEDVDKDRFWYLLKLCCEYHDYGKANTPFQNKLRRKLGEPIIKEGDIDELPHNYLSPAFISPKDLNREEKIIVYQAIAYHHEREQEPDTNLIHQTIEQDLTEILDEINKNMESNICRLDQKFTRSIQKNFRIKEEDRNYKLYVLLKGLLHRLDHSASAHEIVEESVEENIADLTKDYIKTLPGGQLRAPQVFAAENTKNNLLITASTGIGKTETALIWIDDDKAFFTLPLRVSINALFSRVTDGMGYKNTGLIHSTSMDYLDDNGYENPSQIYEQSKLFSKKLSFSTIDQLFKFPFKFKGYEKILATLAYSKVVIDEIQAYSPEITAVILKGLELINKLGGRFMVMTATLPRIYKDYLAEKDIKLVEGKFLSDIKRHRIKLLDCNIDSFVDKIKEKGTTNSVIVIVNTVKKALELYNLINKNGECENCYLLHSMFINKDRAALEQRIKEFSDNKEKGIWITTQIVEASLDVDFDYLYTEMSTLDSQFQRYGRCYRKRWFDMTEPNIYVFTKEATGDGTIYDSFIMEKSIELLSKYNEQVLDEKDKVDLVDILYSKEIIKGSEFYKKFNEALKFLDNVIERDLTSTEAQKVLRDIESYRAIPRDIYDDNLDLFEDYEAAEPKDKMKVLARINKITVNIPKYKLRKNNLISEQGNIKDLYILNTKYDSNRGVLLEESNNIFY